MVVISNYVTILAVVMVAVAFIASFIIRKMLESSKHAETAELKEQEV